MFGSTVSTPGIFAFNGSTFSALNTHRRTICGRSDGDGRGGYAWSVTFLEYPGDVPPVLADNDLTGYSVTITVEEVIRLRITDE